MNNIEIIGICLIVSLIICSKCYMLGRNSLKKQLMVAMVEKVKYFRENLESHPEEFHKGAANVMGEVLRVIEEDER